MELRQLQHFIALAEEQHFTRAAQRVNIVQSALSTSIRQLEVELDAKLVVRTTRHVRLTAAGEVFLAKAKAVLDAVADAKEGVAAVQGLRRGTLSIGTIQSLPPFLDLPLLIEQFHARYPDIEVRLIQEGSFALLERVRHGKLDLAFLPLSDPPPDIETTMIACEGLVVVCATTHRLAGQENVPLSDLQHEPFVDFGMHWGTRKLVDRGFIEAGVERRIAFEVSDLNTLLEFVRRGMGIALLPEAIAEAHRDMIGIAQLADEPEICWELVVAYIGDADDKAVPAGQAAKAFLELFHA